MKISFTDRVMHFNSRNDFQSGYMHQPIVLYMKSDYSLEYVSDPEFTGSAYTLFLACRFVVSMILIDDVLFTILYMSIYTIYVAWKNIL